MVSAVGARAAELFACVQDLTELEEIIQPQSNLVMCTSTCVSICRLMRRLMLVIFYDPMNKFIHHSATELQIVTWLHVHMICVNAPILVISQKKI